MPDTCCAVGCTNRRRKGVESLKFFRIPFGTTEASSQRRKRWVTAIKREQWSENQIDNARICSAHFISGDKSMDLLNPDYVPSLFNYKTPSNTNQSTERYERCKRRRESVITTEPEPGTTTEPEPGSSQLNFEHYIHLSNRPVEKEVQTDPDVLDSYIVKLEKKIDSLSDELILKDEKLNLKEVESQLSYFDIKDNDSLIKFYCGLPSSQLFEWILSLIRNENPKFSSKLVAEQQLFLVLVKLRLGLLHTDVAFRFKILISDVSVIFRRLIVVLARVLKPLIIWPERDAARKYLPSVFKRFKNCNCIIDCTEIYIERPFNLNARAQTWSNYKNTNTIKYLIGVTPAGAVSFLSQGWGGRVSDKEITVKSGFLEKLEHGDCILADRGFTISDEVAAKGAILKIPNFTKGKSQMSGKEVDESREIAHVRIHVERVIGRMRKFRILQSIISINQVDLTNDIMVCICALVNLNRSVVPQK